jgi:hypothetical protein
MKDVATVLYELMELSMKDVATVLYELMELHMKDEPTVLYELMEQPGKMGLVWAHGAAYEKCGYSAV